MFLSWALLLDGQFSFSVLFGSFFWESFFFLMTCPYHLILFIIGLSYLYFIFQFVFFFSSTSSSSLLHQPPCTQLHTHTHTHIHTVFLHHVVCSSIRVLQRNLLLSFDGKICRQYVPPKQWGLVHQIVLWEPQKFLSFGFAFYTLQCFSGVISLWMSVVFHAWFYSIC